MKLSFTLFDLYLSREESYFRLVTLNGYDLVGLYWSGFFGLEYVELFGFALYNTVDN